MPYFVLLALLTFQESPRFQTNVSLVHVDAEVRQDQRLIEGLTKDGLRVTDNGEAYQQTGIETGAGSKLTAIQLGGTTTKIVLKSAQSTAGN